MSKIIYFSPEKKYGNGCDLVIIKDQKAILVEVKKCNLTYADAYKALKQLNNTYEQLTLSESKVYKMLLHDDTKGCKVYSSALTLLEQSKVFLAKLSTGKSNIRHIYNLYRKAIRDP